MCEVVWDHLVTQPWLLELELACEHGYLGIVKYLIEVKGADPYNEIENSSSSSS